MALQLRRGTNAERLSMTPLIGELIFVTDYDLETLNVSAINATTDTLTSVAHGLAVNQQIKFQDANLNGLILNQVYFVKTVPSSDTFTLSLTLAGATVNITGTFSIPLIFATSPTDAAGAPLGTNSTPLWVGDGVTVGGIVAASLNLDDLLDVDFTSLAEGNTFYYDATTGFWRNTAIITVNDVTNNVTLLGDLAVNGGDITTSGSVGNLFNTTATTVNIGNGATVEVNLGLIGAGRVQVKNDLTVTGGDIDRDSPGQGNLFNVNATDINIGYGSLTTRIGAPGVTNTVLIKPGILLGEGTTQNVFNTVATTVNAFGASTTTNIGSTASGTTTIGNNLVVNNDLAVNGGDITTTQTTGNLFNATATTVNVGNGATTEVNLGATSSGQVQIKSPSIVGFNTTQNVFNTVATTVNAFGASTATAIGSTATGTTTIGNNLVVNNDLAVNGGDITTTQTTGNLFNTTATTVNVGFGATAEVNLGASGSGRVQIKSPTIVGESTTQAVFNTVATTVNAFGAATATNIGAGTGTTTIGNNLTVTNDLAVNGGDITTTQTTGNLFNATATTVNVGNGATTEVNLGNTGAGQVQIKSPTIVGANTTQAVFNTVATTVNAFGASTATAIGSTVSGTTTIGYDLVVNNGIYADFITVDNQATLDSSALTTTATATVELNITARNAMTGLINIVQGSNVHCVNFTALRTSASTAMLTTYAEMYDNISLGSFSADVSGVHLRLLVTPSSATSTVFSVVRTSLT